VSPTENSVVVDAYRQCQRITSEQARNFSWGIRLLPPAKRNALSAVYANARRVDDIGDGDLPPAAKITGLDRARHELTHPDLDSTDPRLIALADAAERFPIPLDALGELVDGCRQDVAGHDYESFEDLVGYCRLVAGSIGRLSLGVFAPSGVDLARARQLADSLGVALQLTNILRDIREDFLMGRVYLPAQELKLFGIDKIAVDSQGALEPYDGALVELIRYQAARAWGWYDEGLQLVSMLDRRSAACCAAMAGIYQELLVRIARDPRQVFNARTSLPAKTKLRVASAALAGRRG